MRPPYYPDFEIRVDELHTNCGGYLEAEARTILRKQHNGKFYQRLFVTKLSQKDVSKEELKINTIKKLMEDVYLDILYGTLDPEKPIYNEEGMPLNPEDSFDISEWERLLNFKP